MSWSINLVGKVADVKATVLADTYLPQFLKDVVAQFADANSSVKAPAIAPGGLLVKSSGHYDSNGISNIYELSIMPVTLAQSPTTVADTVTVTTGPATAPISTA